MYFKYSLVIFMGVLAFFTSNSCSIQGHENNNVNVVNMRVNHFKQTGIGEGPYLAFLVQEAENIGSDKWDHLADDIEGFDFIPGYIYGLKVRKKKIKNPAHDASSIKYILVNVISQEKVPEDQSFDIHLKKYGENFVTESGSELFLLDEFKIDCVDLCAELKDALKDNNEVKGNFIHGPEESLILKKHQ